MDSLSSEILSIDRHTSEKLKEACKLHRPRIIFNMADHPDDMIIAAQVNKILSSSLSLEVDYFGFVFNDTDVRQSIKKRTSFLPNYRESITAKSIVQIAERIVKFWDKPVKGSAERIYQHACDIFEERQLHRDNDEGNGR